MRYETKEDLPPEFDTMPDEAKEIYLKAYKESWESFGEGNEKELGQQDRHSTAHRDAWQSVKKEFVHDEDRGMWYRHGEEPEEEDDEGLIDKVTDVL